MAKRAEFDTTTAQPVELPDNVRRLIEDAVQAHLDAAEALILMLDELDGDCEDEGAEHDGREPDVDDEPSLGWTLGSAFGGHESAWGGFDDLEEECEDEGACVTAMEVL